MPSPARRSNRPPSHVRAAAAPQEVANAFFKCHTRRTCPSLNKDAIAIAVHAAVRIPPFTPILVHYGDEYKRNYDVGEMCAELPFKACQNPCDAMRMWRLPDDAFAIA